MLAHTIKWGIIVLGKIYLLTVYRKKEKGNPIEAERDELRELV